MIYYVVIATNVLVSAMLSAVSVPGAVVVEALDGCIVPLRNDAIGSEYREVLRRAKFRFGRCVQTKAAAERLPLSHSFFRKSSCKPAPCGA